MLRGKLIHFTHFLINTYFSFFWNTTSYNPQSCRQLPCTNDFNFQLTSVLPASFKWCTHCTTSNTGVSWKVTSAAWFPTDFSTAGYKVWILKSNLRFWTVFTVVVLFSCCSTTNGVRPWLFSWMKWQLESFFLYNQLYTAVEHTCDNWQNQRK